MADLQIKTKTIKVTTYHIEVSPAEIIEIVKSWARTGWPQDVEPTLVEHFDDDPVPTMIFEGTKTEEVPNG